MSEAKLCADSVKQVKRLLGTLLDLKTKSTYLSEDIVTQWICVPVVGYVPALKSVLKGSVENYGFSEMSEALNPIMLTPAEGMDYFEEALQERMQLVSPKQELALNAHVTYCDSVGRVTAVNMGWLDGKPGQSGVPKSVSKLYNVLKTDSSYHYYPKELGQLASYVTRISYLEMRQPAAEMYIDQGWLNFAKLGGAYIRVSHNVKGDIKEVA